MIIDNLVGQSPVGKESGRGQMCLFAEGKECRERVV